MFQISLRNFSKTKATDRNPLKKCWNISEAVGFSLKKQKRIIKKYTKKCS